MNGLRTSPKLVLLSRILRRFGVAFYHARGVVCVGVKTDACEILLLSYLRGTSHIVLMMLILALVFSTLHAARYFARLRDCSSKQKRQECLSTDAQMKINSALYMSWSKTPFCASASRIRLRKYDRYWSGAESDAVGSNGRPLSQILRQKCNQ